MKAARGSFKFSPFGIITTVNQTKDNRTCLFNGLPIMMKKALNSLEVREAGYEFFGSAFALPYTILAPLLYMYLMQTVYCHI